MKCVKRILLCVKKCVKTNILCVMKCVKTDEKYTRLCYVMCYEMCQEGVSIFLTQGYLITNFFLFCRPKSIQGSKKRPVGRFLAFRTGLVNKVVLSVGTGGWGQSIFRALVGGDSCYLLKISIQGVERVETA